ncbi:28S ribosomal protein S18b, mitochondrial [Stylophora pistillata]|uniref:Small ribosomal subunit protein mS40 n=1 Tax=Stylophora pistillata TaxID=50429 RepID=A0A2B4S496_STYPI|nr:28S ribosomal protein S18b, mitochondrial [Stylophora pistillata]
MAELQHLPAPKGNFMPGPECYQKCLDWVEECELLLNGPLASKSKAVKANYVLIWAGKAGRTHSKSLNLTMEEKGDPSVLFKKFVEWTKPKSKALAAASNFRRLEQGDLSLADYIDKATILCDQCEYPPEARSELTLEEAIEIAQNQDATTHQVGYMQPEFKGEPLQMEVYKLQGNRQSRANQNRQQQQRPASSDRKQGRSKRETCFYCGAKPSHPKSECPAKKAKCFKCGKEGHHGYVCKSKSKDARVNELQVQSTTASECTDCVLNEYEPVYFNAPIRHLKTITVERLNHPKSEPHNRPLWLSQEFSSQIFQIDCEVDTGASCNILLLYKAKALFGNDLKLGKPTVNLKGYNDSPVENLGSCIVYLYPGITHSRKVTNILASRVITPITAELLRSVQYGKEQWLPLTMRNSLVSKIEVAIIDPYSTDKLTLEHFQVFWPGGKPIWTSFRRNFKGQFPPQKTRRNCFAGTKVCSNPCPICQLKAGRRYDLVYTDVGLLSQFICPHTGMILQTSKTGVCQKQHKLLTKAIIEARDKGLIPFTVPGPRDPPRAFQAVGVPSMFKNRK